MQVKTTVSYHFTPTRRAILHICVYIYVYLYVCVYLYTRIHTHTHTHGHVWLNDRIYYQKYIIRRFGHCANIRVNLHKRRWYSLLHI